MKLQFVDTTFRDGSQSLWAAGMRPGMMEAIAEDVGQAGFKVVEVPVMPLNFKKIIRDLKEDPWEMAKMFAEKMPNVKKATMGEPAIFPFEIVGAPQAVVKLYYERIVATGALNRVQIMANIFGNVDKLYPWYLPFLRSQNLEVVLALSYTVSPRHTDEYYAQKTKELVEMKPDVIYLKDQGGLLTVDRIRTLIPIILENANGIPVELHSHCTTGLAEIVYLEAVKLGVRTLHTGIPPLADGSGQPSVLSTVQNANYLGYQSNLDMERIQSASDRLMSMAKQDNMPIGAPLPYDYSQYIYQIPGGVISNLKHQLKELKLENRLDEVLEETVRVREDFGYPVMITPYSQFVVSQSAINVATGERYKVVIDELIQFALGTFSEDSGYTWMDQNLKDKILSLPRVKQLSTVPDGNTPLHKIREQFGGPHLSDEEFLLRYIMKGNQEIEAMRKAGPPKKYFSASTPLVQLLDNLSKQPDITHVQIQGHQSSLLLTNN
jgi:oxaloacetate decarboxylase (Na+ extruding) subunit alpha